MFDQIDPRSAVPLYSQIASRLKVAIASGELQSGVGLPSVRQLAPGFATFIVDNRDPLGEGFLLR